MGKWIKLILVVSVVSFCLFYVFDRPEDAAAAIKNFFGSFGSIGRFFIALSQ